MHICVWITLVLVQKPLIRDGILKFHNLLFIWNKYANKGTFFSFRCNWSCRVTAQYYFLKSVLPLYTHEDCEPNVCRIDSVRAMVFDSQIVPKE